MERNKREKKYVLRIIKTLENYFGHVKCALNFSNPFELLVAAILSAQCTDKTVNVITKTLFKKYRNIEDYANADILEFESYIRPVGFFRNKTKNIIKSAQLILDIYHSVVPQTMEELLVFPGVARKTANVVLGSAFGKTEGIVVDTHVVRISNLLNLTRHEDPVIIEKELMDIIPKKYWIKFSFYMQILGRKICKARNPNHSDCLLNRICPSSCICV
jgi:endonuclease-3